VASAAPTVSVPAHPGGGSGRPYRASTGVRLTYFSPPAGSFVAGKRTGPGARFEQNLVAFLDLVEAAKHYPYIKKAWVEFLGGSEATVGREDPGEPRGSTAGAGRRG
jgi:hypothetical protein